MSKCMDVEKHRSVCEKQAMLFGWRAGVLRGAVGIKDCD